jgi:hypothetical protein
MAKVGDKPAPCARSLAPPLQRMKRDNMMGITGGSVFRYVLVQLTADPVYTPFRDVGKYHPPTQERWTTWYTRQRVGLCHSLPLKIFRLNSLLLLLLTSKGRGLVRKGFDLPRGHAILGRAPATAARGSHTSWILGLPT